MKNLLHISDPLESGIKEAMKLMGMKSWIYWLSWYLKTFSLLLPSLIFMCVAYCIKLKVDGGSYVGKLKLNRLLKIN